MLIQFNFKNILSFRDEASLNLSATKITDFSERVVSIGGEKLLPLAVVYGANASGKSNVYNAFSYMSSFVKESLNYGDDKESFEENLPPKFAFDTDSENEDSSFEVYFTVPDDTRERVYNYGFSIGSKGISEEWLNYRAKTARQFKTIFYRDENEKVLDLSGIPQSNRQNIKIALENQTLIVSLGAKLKVKECKLVRDWFLSNQMADFGNPFSNLLLSQRMPQDFETDREVQKQVVDFLSSFDDAIKGFEVEKVPADTESKQDYYIIRALHPKAGSDKMAEIYLGDESAGTLKMFSLFTPLQSVMQKGSVFFVDELNARLHPLLVRNIMLMFLNPEINVRHAQLVLTTHDTWQLSNQLLRRDEIWFVEKDETGASSLYSLADFTDDCGFRIRKDENYEKNYLMGKYGSIPKLKTIDFFKEG